MRRVVKPASRRTKLLASCAVLAAALLGAQSAWADGIETVTVTASKRATDIQTTPMSITAISGDQLDAEQINSTSDLAMHVPSFVMSTDFIQGEAYIRGIGTDIASISADPSVAFMIDGIYLPRVSNTLQDLFDVDRVEVLNGPQGTLYGRNATGGVINIISKQPSDTFSLDADALYGTYNEQRYRFDVTGPLGDDVSGRLSVISDSRDGYVKNLYLGGTVDPMRSWAGRGSIRIQPNSNLEITLTADYSQDRGAPSSGIHVLSDDAPALLFGGTVTNDPYKAYEDLRNQENTQQYGFSGKVVWNLGDMTLTSLTGYRDSHYHVVLDLDGTQADFFIHDPDTQSSRSFSQEFQLTSNPGGPLSWILGAYYFNEDAHSLYDLFIPIASQNLEPIGSNRTNAYAAYGEATYDVTDKFKLTAGLRFSDENKQATLVEESSGFLIGSFAGGKTWTAFTPKFGAQYFVDPNVMLYATATRGFKSGGFNSTALQSPQGFSPEYVWSYEAGLKSTLLDDRLILNVDGFYYDYSNLQVNKYDSAAVVTLENAAKATIKGLEAEVDYQPINGLTLSSNFSLLDPEYDNYLSVNPDDPSAGAISLKGNQMVRAPKFSMNFAAQYVANMGDSGSLTTRVEYSYRSKIYFTAFDDPGVAQNGYGLLNASVRYDSENGRWSLSAFVDNITNQLYYQEKARSAMFVGTIGWPGVPRTAGVSASIHLD
jgi:iron complex outermembrane receptor protein